MSFLEKQAQEKILDDIFGSEFDFLLDDSKSYEDAVWENNEPPVDIITFIEEPDFLNLKGKIYPAIMYALEQIMRGDIREADIMFGKGSGKTIILEVFLAYSIYRLLKIKNPQDYYNLLKGSSITALLVSVSEKQAKEVGFKGTKNMIENSPWFRGKFVSYTLEMRFDKDINFYCGHSGSTSFLGFNTCVAGMDEVDWHTDTSNRSVGSQLYRALKGSLNTRFPNQYKILCVSSPKDEFSFLTQKFKTIQENGKKIDLPDYIDVSNVYRT